MFFSKTVGGFLKAPLKGVSVPELVPFIFHCWEWGGILLIRNPAPWDGIKHWEAGRCFQIFFIFTPKFGEDFHFDSYFSEGLKPPT